jgi:hypothetical protein
MIRQRIDRLLRGRRCTLLGVGPMSKNCVDAAIELANERNVPIFLIASRRQVECEEMGLYAVLCGTPLPHFADAGLKG